MIRLRYEIDKPWVAVVDGGPLYFAMRRLLHDNGIPTFKTADRALRLFSVFCEKRLLGQPGLTL
jgi:acyl-CoA synthetase (NDP forming)